MRLPGGYLDPYLCTTGSLLRIPCTSPAHKEPEGRAWTKNPYPNASTNIRRVTG